MIKYLRLKNFAVYENCEIEFEDGLTIITGETGAGKSLLTKALELLMGQHANTKYIRPNCEYAQIDILIHHNHQEWAISRKITSKHSIIKINDTLSTLKTCKAHVQKAIYLSTQHEQTTHLLPEYHLSFLDHFIGTPIKETKKAYITAYEAYKNKKEELELFTTTHQLSTTEQEFLNFQIKDIESQDFEINEEKTLKEKKEMIKSYDNQVKYWQTLHDYVSEITDKIHHVSSLTIPNSIQETCNEISCFETFKCEIETKLELINDKLHTLSEFDEKDINTLESRLDQIYRYKTKYKQAHLNDLLEFKNTLIEKQKTSIDFEKELHKKTKELETQLKKCEIISKKLYEIRLKHAPKFENKLGTLLSELDLSDTTVRFTPTSGKLNENGTHEWLLTLSFNKGFEPKAIHTLASGGELSRTLLSLKIMMQEKLNVSCLIFDEIDSGTGGNTAFKIAECLKKIASNSQIICITHQPQIATVAHHHFKITKITPHQHIAKSTITKLNKTEIQNEIEHMLGGKRIVLPLIKDYTN